MLVENIFCKYQERPKNLEKMTIPASFRAVFEMIGPMRPLPNAMQDIGKRIYSEWLPNSGYERCYERIEILISQRSFTCSSAK